MRLYARLIFPILITLWAGIIIGVSLIATPVKFQAPSLSMHTGLEIGRYTFRLLGRVELCLLIATIATAGIAQLRWSTIVLIALVVVGILLQRCWLLPLLDNKVGQILAGGAPSFSIQHGIYGALEAAKAVLLIAGAVMEYRTQFIPC